LIRRIRTPVVAVLAGRAAIRAPACESQNRALEKPSPARLNYFIACTDGAVNTVRIAHKSATFKVQGSAFPQGQLKIIVSTRINTNKYICVMESPEGGRVQTNRPTVEQNGNFGL
jgi:hypothetical protein